MEKERITKDLPDDGDIKRLLGSLERISAPGDLAFRVKAKIAEQKSSGPVRRGWRPAFLRVAAPAALTVAVAAGGYFAFIAGPEMPSTIAVVEEPQQFAPPQRTDTAQAEPPVSSSISGGPVAISSTVANVEKVPAASRTSQREARREPSTTGGGSTVRAARPPDAPLLPRGIEPEAVISGTRPGEGASEHRISEILQMIGIDAERGPMGWNVVGTTSAGLGGRAGIRAGDIVVAIDGKPITDTEVTRGTTTIRSLQVIREGRRLTVPLSR
jgi:membrane-associated protease RseP (regulator of RpoE activity)